MALVFQYGSNASEERLNSKQRLDGAARKIGIARTVKPYEFGFTAWSTNNNCATADIMKGGSRRIWGVLYEIPESKIFRDQKQGTGLCLDEIESEGMYYKRVSISLEDKSGNIIDEEVLTYIVLNDWRGSGVKPSEEYAGHILKGLAESQVPEEYIEYVKEKVRKSNKEIVL